MTIDTINRTLQERFAAELPDCYQRRIIFWFDSDREFEKMLDELEIPGVKLLKLTGDNFFAAKMLLSETDTQNNYLVYDPNLFPSGRQLVERYSALQRGISCRFGFHADGRTAYSTDNTTAASNETLYQIFLRARNVLQSSKISERSTRMLDSYILTLWRCSAIPSRIPYMAFCVQFSAIRCIMRITPV